MRLAIPLFLLLTLGLALSAHAVVPGQVNYQGLLLDGGGSPVTGNEDFVFSLFDVASGGSALWTETHTGVPVLDGVYDVVLGSTTPITPGLVAGGDLYLEISVGGETLVPRQRLLAVPYALRADTAESAGSVGTLPSLYVEQLLEHYSFDGQDPPNLDASEGTDDVDADGLPNFLDADNDGDGLDDGVEIGQGSDINLVTPTIASFGPTMAPASEVTNVTVTGEGFEPGLSVSFGSQSPTPQNLTFTSFDVDVGPQSAGSKSVVVTNPNAESDTQSFTFVDPIITSLSPRFSAFDATTLVTVNGSGFLPGLQVSFGSQNPTPQNLTPTSFKVSVGPQPAGAATVGVSYPSGPVSSAIYEFVDGSTSKVAFVTSTSQNGNLGGVAGADAICAARAAAGSLPGTFLAWIGDSSTDPATRFSRGHPYTTSTGSPIAGSFVDLTDSSLTNFLNRDESGAVVTAFVTVWTGVEGDGTASAVGNRCADWTTGAGSPNSALLGRVGEVNDNWTSFVSGACNVAQRLYCFEQ